MYRAIGVSAEDLAEFALLCAIGNDGIGGVLASPVLRPIALLFRFVLADFNVLIALKNRAAFGRFAVSGRDLESALSLATMVVFTCASSLAE